MSRSVYLTAMGPASGKSIVALGVVELLSHRVSRLGFFRPVIRTAEPPDNDMELIRSRYHLDTDHVAHALTSDDVRAMAGGGRTEAADVAMAEVVAAYKALEARSDMVVIEGTDFTGVSSPIEFEVNARVANHLGAPVLAVVNGHGRDVGEIRGAVRLGEESLLAQGDTVLALIVNRVDPALLEAVAEMLAARPAGSPPAWAIPEDETLRHATLGELARALDAELLAGSPDDLTREARHVRVAAMSVANLLDRLEDGTVLLTPGDRPDVLLAAALTRQSEAFPSVTGVVLTGGLRPDPRVAQLLEGQGDGTKALPLLLVESDTFDTATEAAGVEGALTPDNERKVEAALGLFEAHVDLAALERRIQVARSTTVTPVMFQYELIERARAAGARLVLPEGEDDRILEAAERLARRKVVELTLLGPEAAVRQRASELGLDLPGVTVVDPDASPWFEEFTARYLELRAHKGTTLDLARDLMGDVSFFGTMMVHEGIVDGMVSGATHTTAATLRPAFEIIRTQPGVSIVSSVFLMLLADRVLVYGDCAVNPDPDAAQLADIAISSAQTAVLFGIEPRIAMLSYSTGESGHGADVDKVRDATELVRARRPDLKVEGPIQYDAAVDTDVASAKLPGSLVAGQATVFIFPDLNTGNNTYKAVQRSAGAVAVGPVLQGLNRPVNDLSRGATVTDIVNTIAITAIQAAQARST